MDNFGIMLKSYGPDLQYAQRFLESFLEYAAEAIPLYVVVPDQDIPAFTEAFAHHATVLPESLWADQLVDYPIHGNNPGYINQEIIKLAFAEAGYLRNYLCADSEAVFIRPFSSRDFMDPNGVPYSFITEDHELHVDPIYFETYWKGRERFLMRIREFLELPATPIATCHNMAVFSSERVLDLKKYLFDRGLNWADALEISPYEFGWYNFWVEKVQGNARRIREPIVLMLHQSHQYLEYSLKGTTEPDLARGYIAVLINSGFSRSSGVGQLNAPLETVLGSYVDYRDLMGAIFERLFIRMPRIRSLLGKVRWPSTS